MWVCLHIHVPKGILLHGKTHFEPNKFKYMYMRKCAYPDSLTFRAIQSKVKLRYSLLSIKINTTDLQWPVHWRLVYHGCFELILESFGKNPIAKDLGKLSAIFFFILKYVYCVYSLESPLWGDSNENIQHTFMLKKTEKISLLCLLTWHCDKRSLARTTPVSHIFSWFQRCSSH